MENSYVHKRKDIGDAHFISRRPPKSQKRMYIYQKRSSLNTKNIFKKGKTFYIYGIREPVKLVHYGHPMCRISFNNGLKATVSPSLFRETCIMPFLMRSPSPKDIDYFSLAELIEMKFKLPNISGILSNPPPQNTPKSIKSQWSELKKKPTSEQAICFLKKWGSHTATSIKTNGKGAIQFLKMDYPRLPPQTKITIEGIKMNYSLIIDKYDKKTTTYTVNVCDTIHETTMHSLNISRCRVRKKK
tara:strand:- start:365 stop:1096 length:732 start_codon:yes stop_codon:yes gene_type:complete